MSVMIMHRGVVYTPEYIPCHERLFNGGEAPQKKEMAPQGHLFFNYYYIFPAVETGVKDRVYTQGYSTSGVKDMVYTQG